MMNLYYNKINSNNLNESEISDLLSKCKTMLQDNIIEKHCIIDNKNVLILRTDNGFDIYRMEIK